MKTRQGLNIAVATFAYCRFTALPTQALPKPEYPVIFIHGLNSSASEAWGGLGEQGKFREFLATQARPPGGPSRAAFSGLLLIHHWKAKHSMRPALSCPRAAVRQGSISAKLDALDSSSSSLPPSVGPVSGACAGCSALQSRGMQPARPARTQPLPVLLVSRPRSELRIEFL